jgi:DNA-binding transcriptional MerR regulator
MMRSLETFKLLQSQHPDMKKSLIPHMRIGQAAQASGMSTASIRFYEQHGLLSAAVRQDNGYRTYSAHDIDRLRQIRTCRSLDMSLDEVQHLLNVQAGGPEACELTSHVLRQHLQHVEDRITELTKLKSRLRDLMAMCSHDPSTACPTQAALRQPSSSTDHRTSHQRRHV